MNRLEILREADAKIIMALFPAEIWIAILKQTDNYADYLKISGSCQIFNCYLKPLKATILFPQVIKPLCLWSIRDERNRTFDRLFLWKYLSMRRVCHTWNRGVDNVWDNVHTFHSKCCPKFSKERHFQKFWKRFENPHHTSANPFVFRTVEILFPSLLTDPDSFYRELVKILQKFGHQIWKCRLNLYTRSVEVAAKFYHQMFGTILKLMPNLRFLASILHCTPLPDSNLFEDIMYNYRFPTLKHLDKVSLGSTPAPIIRRLLRDNPSIRNISTSYPVYNHHQMFLEEAPDLQNLTILIYRLSDFHRIRHTKVTCPLKKLILCMHTMTNLEVPWNAVFSTLSYHFGKTLEDLFISFPKSQVHKILPGDKLVLPKLKSLRLVVEHCVDLEFLLPTQNTLTELSITVRGHNNLKENVNQNAIKLFEFGNRIQMSNVWELFGKLKVVKVKYSDNPEIIHSKNI